MAGILVGWLGGWYGVWVGGVGEWGMGDGGWLGGVVLIKFPSGLRLLEPVGAGPIFSVFFECFFSIVFELQFFNCLLILGHL
jgi:hypothetical protein